MVKADPVTARGCAPHAQQITSRINRALTPREIVCALADETTARLIAFDYCALILPAPGDKGMHIWRAPRAAEFKNIVAKSKASKGAYTLLAPVINGGDWRLLDERELRHDERDDFGPEVKSALALPLLVGGQGFGALCFASEAPNAYQSDDARELMWLADHVAAMTQAASLRAQLETVTDDLGEIERLKSGFVNTLVRDIRLPLTSVLGVLELFESKLQTRDPFDLEDKQLLGSAIENGDRMRKLLDDLLEIARQQERPLALNLETLDAMQLIEEVAEPLRGEAALRGVDLSVRAMSASNLALHADAQQTRRALRHLLTAALAATPDGGAINIEAQTITGTRAGDEGRRFVVINVTDSSEGIPAEQIPFVFDAFWQAADVRAGGAGRGIGLAIAKRIAAAHGGNVAVRSQLGLGTTYSIVLPASPQQEEAPADMRRVLIVDDAPELLLLLRKLVARMNYQVEAASDARQAISILQGKQIDLLLTDWAMPGMNGGELIQYLKQDERLRNIPTIVLTGHDTERRNAMTVSCDRFLVKPVKRDELQRTINELLPTMKA